MDAATASDLNEVWNANYSPWQYVHCGVCYLPFVNPKNPDAGPPVPFWLTECSHVVCNNHLNSDQSCRQCGTSQPVEVSPLQRELAPPMSTWFCNVPNALEDLVGAVKFQNESMAHLLQFYKNKVFTQKELIERLRREVENLKAENGQMKQELEGQTSFEFNENGKRRRVDGPAHSINAEDQYQAQRYSSPAAFGNGARPSRLTLRPGSSRVEQEQAERRSSPLSLEEFAYQPNEDQRPATARVSPQSSRKFTNLETTHPQAHSSSVKTGPNLTRVSGNVTDSVGGTLNAGSHSIRSFDSSNQSGSGRFKPSLDVRNPQPPVKVVPQVSMSTGSTRFQAPLPATPIPRREAQIPSRVSYVPPSRNGTAATGVMNTPRPLQNRTSGFVPPTPVRQSLQQNGVQQNTSQQRRQFSVSGRNQNGLGQRVNQEVQGQRVLGNGLVRPDSRMQMPPPPLPGSSRFSMGGLR